MEVQGVVPGRLEVEVATTGKLLGQQSERHSCT